jgi:hypothetical protein
LRKRSAFVAGNDGVGYDSIIAVRGERFFRMGIELAGADVPLDRGVELPGVEGLEPGAKPRQFARGKRIDGSLDVFGCDHIGNIAVAPVTGRATDPARCPAL